MLLGDASSWFRLHHDPFSNTHYRLDAPPHQRDSGVPLSGPTPQSPALLWAKAGEEDARSLAAAHAARTLKCKSWAPADALAAAYWTLGVRSVLDIGAGGLEWLRAVPSALAAASEVNLETQNTRPGTASLQP